MNVSSGQLPVRSRADCRGAALWAQKMALAAGWPKPQADEVSLVVVELCSNAVRHANHGTCHLSVDDEAIEIEVLDRGEGFPVAVLKDGGRSDRLGAFGPLPPGERQGHGLGSGLACARRLVDDLVLENRSSGGARICARRRRQRARRGASRI